jgi:ubiquinol-cytochrome c reductase subunit 8
MTTGTPKQKGVTTYGLSLNRQRPLAGSFHNAIFNTWRRFRNQVLYVAPPLLVGYYAMNWAIERFAAVSLGTYYEIADHAV